MISFSGSSSSDAASDNLRSKLNTTGHTRNVFGLKDDTTEENEFFNELDDVSVHCLLQDINTNLKSEEHDNISFVQPLKKKKHW